MPDPVDVAMAAAAAGAEVVRRRAHLTGAIRAKGDPSDLVTETDVEAGVAVVDSILAASPGAHLVVEEPEVCRIVGIEPGSLEDEQVWVVDPLDGTTSYIHGYPCYSVSVAFLVDGQPRAGAVCNVPTGEMYAARAGAGATLDGTPIHVTDAAGIGESLLITGFPYDRGATLDRQLAILERVLRTVHGLRRDGSAALDCCQVAAARADGFWELALKPWDVAAGVLIASEAGALVTDFQGRPWTTSTEDHIVAAPRLHAELLGLIAGIEADRPDGA